MASCKRKESQRLTRQGQISDVLFEDPGVKGEELEMICGEVKPAAEKERRLLGRDPDRLVDEIDELSEGAATGEPEDLGVNEL